MLSVDERAAIQDCLHGIGTAASEVEAQTAALEEAASSCRRRRERGAESPRIAVVVGQLAALERAAKAARSGKKIAIPTDILPETINALVGHYPFSNLDLAPVTLESLRDREQRLGIFRTAVVGATVQPHVINAAMRQLPSVPHLLAVRAVPFPYFAANKYFFGDLPDPKESNLRRRLEQFIVGGPGVALEFIREVHERVRRATRDPERENSGRRTLYQWAEPLPEARLAFDVCQIVLEPMTERPPPAIQSILIDLLVLLVNVNDGVHSDGRDERDLHVVRRDIISSMLTIWVALNQHQRVARRLSAILDCNLEASTACRRSSTHGLLAMRCHGAVADSTAELLRRGYMGDFYHVRQIRRAPPDRGEQAGMFANTNAILAAPKARATGLPVPTIDLAGIAEIGTDLPFLWKLARACKPWI
jgi:hypothetical protein